jgi:hypothetical protein
MPLGAAYHFAVDCTLLWRKDKVLATGLGPLFHATTDSSLFKSDHLYVVGYGPDCLVITPEWDKIGATRAAGEVE